MVDANRFKYASYAALIVVDLVLLNQFFVVGRAVVVDDMIGGK